MNPGNAAEWLGAIGTLSAVIVALFLGLRESRLLRKKQTLEQASTISAWPVYFGITKKTLIMVANNSDLPIYDVVFSFGVAYGAGPAFSKGIKYQTIVSRIPPGRYYVKAPKSHDSGAHTKLGISMCFRDSEGVYWLRDATGKLHSIKDHPFSKMDVDQPIGKWESLDPVEPLYMP